MKKSIRKATRPVALGIAVLLFTAVPGVALAQADEAPLRHGSAAERPTEGRSDRDRDLDAFKARIEAAIEKRLEALERLSEAVSASEQVSANHAAHLQNDFRAAERILEDALEDVEEAETLAELREIVPEVFQETLVFALLKPKTHLVLVSHAAVALTERLEGFADTLQAVIDRLSGQGHDMSEAQFALDEMITLIGEAASVAEQVAGDVVDLDQDDWPDPAKAALESGTSDLRAARDLLRQARERVREVIEAIREALASD